MFINTLVEAHESSTPIDTIYLDIRKAFNSVPHKELLTKLWSLGIRGSLWRWFNAYLTNRKQCVRIKESTAACAIWGTPGQHSRPTAVYTLYK